MPAKTTKHRTYWMGHDDDAERPYVIRNLDGATLFRFATFAEGQQWLDAEAAGQPPASPRRDRDPELF